MSGGHEQVPESFIRELGAKRRRLVDAQEENDVNLDALVDFLYPDAAHLVFELLQNAEDAEATSARFELSDGELSFTHDGEPFSAEDIDDITNYFKSAKYEKEDKIGRFGIGFKSVFWCTETPRIYSDTVAFEIVDRIVPRAIPRPPSSRRSSSPRTVIQLPFNGKVTPVEEVRGQIRRGVTRMPSMSILHLANIGSIEWRTDDGDSGSITRTELADGVVRIDAKTSAGEESHYFLRFREPYAEGSSLHLDVVFELEEKEAGQETIGLEYQALSDRFRVVPAKPGKVAVFFAADKETSNLRFHLHAPFIPELSRASIKKHADNDDLFARLATLVARSLPAIRDSGLLDRDFLGVLPNSLDSLSGVYPQFREAVVRAMLHEPLVPMHGGGHERAARLLQGRKEFKDFLGVDDIQFLMSGSDLVRQPSPPKRAFRPRGLSSDYRGWAVAATPGNNAADRFLADMEIRRLRRQHLVPPESEKDNAVERWIKPHDADWHRAYYASIAKHWGSLAGTHRRLCGLPMVRTRSGEYRSGDECRFAANGDDAPEGVAIADSDTYSAGKGAKDARKGLERLGVREIDDESRVVGILDKHYGDSDDKRPSWDRHRGHVEQFIELLGAGKVAAATFQERCFLLDSGEDWEPPRNLYAGNGYADSSAAPYYRSLERLSASERRQCPVRYELHRRYRDIAGFDEFARRIGVAYKRMPVVQVGCGGNPDWRHLQSGRGRRFTGNGTDRDWNVPNLEVMLQRLEQAQQPQSERKGLASAIHATLDEARSHTWPPPDDPTLWGGSYWPDDYGYLVAIYRRNTNAGFRTAPSQLVYTLRNRAWVPQDDGEDGFVFVKPCEARAERLPEGFSLDPGWAWVKATEFGKDLRERQRRVAQAERDEEAMAVKREASAKDLGFETVEEAEWFVQLSGEDRKAIREWHESRNRPPSRFDPPRNPERRRRRAKEQAKQSPRRNKERRERSILVGEAAHKEEARAKLRANYEEHAHVSLCQVIGCGDRSFKVNGTWYFEAVRFLRLDQMVEADYLALCPRHAAMFRHANESREELKGEFAVRSAAGNGDETLEIPVALAGENVEIILAPNHVIDLAAALEVDGNEGEPPGD